MPVVTAVPEHSHCEMCHKPITLGDRLCGSEACKAKFDASVRAKKRGMYLFVGLIFVLLVLTQLGRL